MENILEKSEIIYLFEGKYTIPNGDPFTGEQRYDEETKKILVSDVRIKRYIRDYFIEQNILYPEKYEIYVYNDKSQVAEGAKGSGSSARMQLLWNKYTDKKPAKNDIGQMALNLMKKCIDVRLFGGISTEKDAAVNLTGPVQFAILNPSLNKIDLRIHQNTSVFSSSADKSRGSIGTTSVVPYSINQIIGWVNPFSAKKSDLSDADIHELFTAMWNSVNNVNTRSKSNQSSILLLQLVYNEPNDKVYGIDNLISIDSEKEEEQIRSIDDYSLDFSKLEKVSALSKIKEIRFYTEIDGIKKQILGLGNKFKEMTL